MLINYIDFYFINRNYLIEYYYLFLECVLCKDGLKSVVIICDCAYMLCLNCVYHYKKCGVCDTAIKMGNELNFIFKCAVLSWVTT